MIEDYKFIGFFYFFIFAFLKYINQNLKIFIIYVFILVIEGKGLTSFDYLN
jgi:hypothetical protein